MTTPTPLQKVTELECRNGHVGTPILVGGTQGGAATGAYCANCRIWIKWVPQNQVWLALLESQQYTRAGHTNPPDLSTAPEPPIDVLPDFDDEAQFNVQSWVAWIAHFCNEQAKAMGFLDKERTLGDMLSLINSEMSELFEAHRKGTSQNDSEHIPAFSNKEEEWADIGIRWFCHAVEDGVAPIRLGKAVAAKLVFNRTRGYRHGGKRV